MEIGALILVSERAVASVLSAAGRSPPPVRFPSSSSSNSSLLFSPRCLLRDCPIYIQKRYYTGFPKDLGPSRVIHFTSEREFVQLLHQGHPVVVAFTIKCNPKHLDKVLDEAAAEFDPHVKFMRVECRSILDFALHARRNIPL
ncbi:hypothetical protein Sango_1974600 [Sesamum angolense]|uniref:Uncharacterized protein n=1 Tax=Sesamum angolense TaxID=2727404 RepID=A0AAE2BNP3_9LAMI|nr:hypothetical protein Sango_1974600 [Sesamum angolense]